MTTGIVNIGPAELWYEDFGDSANPAILLIMGAGGRGTEWPDDLCNSLAKEGYYVIRYDHRDVGLSTHFNFKETPYTLNELMQDALLLLDTLKISQAHIMGVSMGGFIAQMIAINYPERMLSQTLLMTSPEHQLVSKPFMRLEAPKSDLPIPDSSTLEKMYGSPEVETNHMRACIATLGNTRQFLKKITIPTLVIHGTDDVIVPYQHGKALADEISNAELVIIEKMGHGAPPPEQLQIMQSAMLKFLHPQKKVFQYKK